MKKQILISTSPLLQFDNHSDNTIKVLTSTLQLLGIDSTVLLASLEIKIALTEENNYKEEFELNSEKYLTLYGILLKECGDFDAIWFLQNEHEDYSNNSYLYIKLLTELYPEKKILFFANENVNFDLTSLKSVYLIKKNNVTYKNMQLFLLKRNESLNVNSDFVNNFTKSEFIDNISCSQDAIEKLFTANANDHFAQLLYKNRRLNRDNYPTRLSIDMGILDYIGIDKQILYYTSLYQILDYDLGLIDTDNTNTLIKINELKNSLSKLPYDFNFHCTIYSNSNTELFNILREARINSVTILPEKSPGNIVINKNVLIDNLSTIERVKKLHELGINVYWKIIISNEEVGEDLWIMFINDLSIFYGFPAPIGISFLMKSGNINSYSYMLGENNSIIDEAQRRITSWMHHPIDNCLSIGHGPYFSKLFDKRGEPEFWSFLDLNHIQSMLYKQLDKLMHIDDIKKIVRDIDPAKIENFLQFLCERKIIISVDKKYFLNASQRRKFDQAWATAEL